MHNPMMMAPAQSQQQPSLTTAPLLLHQQQSMIRTAPSNGVNPLFGNPPSPLGSQAGGIYAQVRSRGEAAAQFHNG